MDEDDDWTAEDEAQHLADVRERLREGRTELARTIRALRAKRRTPEQIRAVIDRARRLIYKSVLLRRKFEQQQKVH